MDRGQGPLICEYSDGVHSKSETDKPRVTVSSLRKCNYLGLYHAKCPTKDQTRKKERKR